MAYRTYEGISRKRVVKRYEILITVFQPCRVSRAVSQSSSPVSHGCCGKKKLLPRSWHVSFVRRNVDSALDAGHVEVHRFFVIFSVSEVLRLKSAFQLSPPKNNFFKRQKMKALTRRILT